MTSFGPVSKARGRRVPAGWLFVGGAVVVIVFVAVVLAANGEARRTESKLLPGKLNDDAVTQAQNFADYPVLWLGTEFKGYQLTRFNRRNEPHDDSVSLIYGDCEGWGTEGPSCVPPLEVRISRPTEAERPPGAPTPTPQSSSVRGAPAYLEEGGLIVYLGDVEANVRGPEIDREAAIPALRLANAAAMGLPEIGPGESLVPALP